MGLVKKAMGLAQEWRDEAEAASKREDELLDLLDAVLDQRDAARNDQVRAMARAELERRKALRAEGKAQVAAELGGKLDELNARVGNLPTMRNWKKTHDAVMAGLDAKTRRGQQAKRILEEGEMNERDPDLQSVLRAVAAEVKAQSERGKKANVSDAIRSVLKRPDCPRSEEDFESVRRAWNRRKRRK